MAGDPPRFGSPPLTEALVEFTFGAGEDLTLLGQFYDAIRADFPDKEREVRSPLGPVSDAPDVMRFFRPDRTALVRVGEGSLSVHHVGLHAGWPALRAFALAQLGVYRGLMPPAEVGTASVRYVNRVRLPGPPSAFSAYVTMALPWPPGVSDDETPFRDLYVQAVLPYPSDALDLAVYLVQVPASDESGTTYVLDLVASATGPLGPDAVEPWLDSAHGRIRTFFERAFTDRARTDLFAEPPRP